ncbi:hypothetical protein [Streptomyces sp. NPDC005732]|uniref:AMP-binding enzyme n=1 Tax=Streptomyces sp. NPDC005732 TaxID=3157057 RepID=UPI00340C55B3
MARQSLGLRAELVGRVGGTVVEQQQGPVAELVAWAREGLAAFKVPRYVEFRDELPYTASGKVHKAALKEEADPLHDGVVDTKA